MLTFSIKLILIILFFSLMGCKDEPISSDTSNDSPFKVSGIVTYDGLYLSNTLVTLDSLECFTDSIGSFTFDSLYTNNLNLKITHPRFKSIDTVLTNKSNHYLTLEMKLRDNSYMPLQIGNKWYYSKYRYPNIDSSYHDLIIEIIDEVIIENETYYKLSFTGTRFYFPFVDNSRNGYLRISNDSLFTYHCGNTQLLAPFNISIDQTFNLYLIDQSCFFYTATLFDIEHDLLKYDYTSVDAFDISFTLYYQKGIGITRYSLFRTVLLLTKYEINY
jgi:hypothetical protein